MTVRFEPHSATHSRIFDAESGDTLEVVHLDDLHARLRHWRREAAEQAASVRAFLDTPHQPVTVTYRTWPRRVR